MKKKIIYFTLLFGFICIILICFGIGFMIKNKNIDEKDKESKYTKITSKQVESLVPEMSREDVLKVLGETTDVGSGKYIYIYEVDNLYLLKIVFDGADACLNCSAEDLLNQLEQEE